MDEYTLIKDLAWAIKEHVCAINHTAGESRSLTKDLAQVEDEFASVFADLISQTCPCRVETIGLSDYVSAQLVNVSQDRKVAVCLDRMLKPFFRRFVALHRQYNVSSFPDMVEYVVDAQNMNGLVRQVAAIVHQLGTCSLVDDNVMTGGTLAFLINLIRKVGGDVDSVFAFASTSVGQMRLENMGVNAKTVFPHVRYPGNARDLLLEGKYLGTVEGDPIFVPTNQLLSYRLSCSINKDAMEKLGEQTIRSIQKA